MDEDLDELDDDVESEDEHASRMGEVAYWATDAYDDDRSEDPFLAFARDDPDE